MRQKIFKWLAGLVTGHPGKVLIFCVFMTIVMIVASTRLSMKTQFADMLPEEIPQIKEFMEIVEDYGSESTVMITIESKTKNTKKMKACAEELAARLENINLPKPADESKLTIGQKIALARGQYPEDISYDTLELVKRIDYKVDNDFIANHGMMIQKTKDLESMIDQFGSLELPAFIRNINDNFEKEYIEDSDNLTTLDGEGQAVQGLEGMRKFLLSIGHFIDNGDSAKVAQAVADFVTGPQYFLSPDNTMLLLMLQPTVSFNEFEDLMYLGYRIDDTLALTREAYPDIEIGRTGAMMIQIDENYTMEEDFGWPSLIILGLILILLIGSFRTWKNPFYSVITLVAGIVWTAGILALVLHYLNMMSAGFGIVLIGLGIDFGIHFISGYRDGREQGKSPQDSIFYMYNRVGAGVWTGALTTAIVFFTMPLTRFEAYSQMGLAMGIGIVTVLIAMMLMLPPMIVWDNKGYSIVGNAMRKLKLGFLVIAWNAIGKVIMAFFHLPVFGWISSLLQFGFLSVMGRLFKKPVVAVVALIACAAFAYYSITNGMKMEWEYDMMELSAKGALGCVTQEKILDRFEISPDFAMVKAGSIEECRDMVRQYKKIGNRTGLIGQVDAITEYLPEEQTQLANAELIRQFSDNVRKMAIPVAIDTGGMNELSAQLERLHQNIVEIGELSVMSSGEKNKIIRKCDQITGTKDEDSYVLALAGKIKELAEKPEKVGIYQSIMARVLKEKLIAMASTDIVTFDNLPEDIRKRYVNPRNDDLLINVYPKGYIWEENNMKKFNEQTSKVSERITGMPALMQIMMSMMAEKGRIAIICGACAILIFLLLDFRSVTYTLLAAIPLAFGVIWMVGLMALAGMKLSMINFMALPLIIGIGIDDGVHILHRYRIEGRGSIPLVLKYTGRAILLTSLTTMIGFGSMGLASHRGLAGLGQTLFFGVGCCFLSSIIALPAIITLWEKFFPEKQLSEIKKEDKKL